MCCVGLGMLASVVESEQNTRAGFAITSVKHGIVSYLLNWYEIFNLWPNVVNYVYFLRVGIL